MKNGSLKSSRRPKLGLLMLHSGLGALAENIPDLSANAVGSSDLPFHALFVINCYSTVTLLAKLRG